MAEPSPVQATEEAVPSASGVYVPISNNFEIRLLELLPATGDDPSADTHDDDIVRVELHSASLESLPPFEAISYCWGDPSDVRSIHCNDVPLDITVSLYGALRRFRPAAGQPKRTLWADAICIQQTNLVEKASQVLHMPHVYSRADRVLVWLGEDNDDPRVADVPACLRQAMAFLPDMPLDSEALYATQQRIYGTALEMQRQGKPNFLDHDWTPLVALLTRPWFRRKWVVQEVCLAQDILVACGRITFPWAHLAEVAYNTAAGGILLQILGSTSLTQHASVFRGPGLVSEQDQATDNDNDKGDIFDDMNLAGLVLQNIQIMRMIRTFRHVGQLLDCIMATPLFECSDPRDHIYAVLSVPQNPTSHYQLRPDYTLTTEQVFTAFAVATLVGDQNLKLLGLCPQLSRPPRTVAVAESELPPPPTVRLLPDLPVDKRGRNVAQAAGSLVNTTATTSDSIFTRSEPLDLPSWVPNLTGMGIINPFTCYSVLPQLFHAGGPTTPPISVSDDHTLLYLQARVVDTIATILPSAVIGRCVPSEADIAPFLARFDNHKELAATQLWRRNLLLVSKNFVLGVDDLENSPATLPMTPEQWSAFARVMTSEMNNRRDPLPPAVYDAFDEYVEHALGMFETPTPTDTGASAQGDGDGDSDGAAKAAAAAKIDEMMSKYSAMIETSMVGMSTMRMLARTTSGRLCQVSAGTREGDSVVVVIGAEAPFVMRKVDQPEPSGDETARDSNWKAGETRFKLLGDSYVMGIMQGEVLNDLQYETKQITVQ
ncbi:hypothetical protein SPBR_08203 [Sporothrix brasiliensis 5110]|uniref:Heterokaryon incompatibility domain-containing protein n=1 Tax=Sporothrix brasiliensis 5110 TaxID=1398154 RepID=A0A0C2EKA6_9PEZI|nr:uncharacterized protein SPBR_08203 [Sporothrix brasiliensis 5110]KIH86519.1 hypothetical protein SPBR_08203 [Sporothrix brasiliensis 5110]